MIDGYGGDQELLNNKEIVALVIDELPTKLGMKKLAEPVIYSAPDNGIKDPGGWSGFVVIAESHIAVHTFPKRGFVSADIYTCRNGLEVDSITTYFKETFKLSDVEINFVKRGTRYPVENIH